MSNPDTTRPPCDRGADGWGQCKACGAPGCRSCPHVTYVSPEIFEMILKLNRNPPPPTPKMLEVMRRYEEMLADVRAE